MFFRKIIFLEKWGSQGAQGAQGGTHKPIYGAPRGPKGPKAWPGQAWEPKSQFFDEKKRPCEERSPGPEGLESPENQFLVKI